MTHDLNVSLVLSEDPEFWIEEICNVEPALDINNLQLKDSMKQSEYLEAKIKFAKEEKEALVS